MKILIFQYPYLMMMVFFMLGGFVGMFLAGLMRMAADHDAGIETRVPRETEDEHAFSWRAERD